MTIEIDDKEDEVDHRWFLHDHGQSDVPLVYVNYEYISKLVGEPGMVYSLRVITSRHDSGNTKQRQRSITGDLRRARGTSDQRAVGRRFCSGSNCANRYLRLFHAGDGGDDRNRRRTRINGYDEHQCPERTREIGVMRAIGASNFDIQSIVIAEGMVIGLISWVISIFMSVPITNILTFGVGTAMFQFSMPTIMA